MADHSSSATPRAAAADPPLRLYAHALSGLLAVASLALCLVTWGKVQILETLYFLITGGFGVILTYASWRGRRSAWSFLTAINGVQAAFHLFGAPSVARHLGVSMVLMLLPAALFAVAATALALSRAAYQTR